MMRDGSPRRPLDIPIRELRSPISRYVDESEIHPQKIPKEKNRMGMYTELICECKVKPEYQAELLLLQEAEWPWELGITKEFSEFGKDGRSIWVKGTHVKGLNWKFEADLKNYDNTLGKFIYDVLPVICSRIYRLETLYEENNTPDVFVFSNGHIIQTEWGKREY